MCRGSSIGAYAGRCCARQGAGLDLVVQLRSQALSHWLSCFSDWWRLGSSSNGSTSQHPRTACLCDACVFGCFAHAVLCVVASLAQSLPRLGRLLFFRCTSHTWPRHLVGMLSNADGLAARVMPPLVWGLSARPGEAGGAAMRVAMLVCIARRRSPSPSCLLVALCRRAGRLLGMHTL